MKKKITIVLVSGGLIALVLFALLPVLLSSGIVLDNILARFNIRPDVTLKVANCDIGWLQGPVCSAVEYSNTGLGFDLQIDQVRGSQGLLALLAAPKNLGTISIRQPVLTLKDQPTDPVAQRAPGTLPENISEKQQPPSSDLDQTKPPFWDTLVVSLVVEEGRVLAQGRGSASVTSSGIYSATASLASGTVKYTLQWLTDAGTGKLFADGFINLPARKSYILETMVVRMQLQISDLQVAPLLSIASLWGDVPRGSGLVSGELTMTGAGPDNLDVIGHLDCSGLELSGGVLGADHPRIQELSLQIDGRKKEQAGWRIAQFDLEGDPGRMTASGEYGSDVGQVGLTGVVNLPILFNQFSHFFHVQKGTSLTKGELKFSADLNRKGGRQRITTDATVDSLEGIYNNHPFSWDKPVTLAFAGEQASDALKIEQLNIVTSFFQATGKGTLTDFSLQAEADVEKASLELGKLFALPWTGKGTLSLQVLSRLTDESRYEIDLQAESMEFLLLKEGQVILPEYPLRINGRLSLPSAWMQKQGVADLQLDGSVWPGRFFLRAGNLRRSGNTMTAWYDLTAWVNLGSSSELLHNLQVLPLETTLGGQLNLSASGFLTETQVVLRELDVRVEDFVYEHGETTLQENNLVLQTKKIPMDGRSIGVRKLLVTGNMTSLQDLGFGLTSFDRVKQKLFLRDMRFRSTLPGITPSTGAQVLSGVQLDQTLTRAVLEKVHPLFGVLARPTGTIDARLDEFYWPVVAGGAQLAKFTSVFDVGQVQLDSRGVLQDVLALMKLDNQPLTLKENTITCIGKQGRISCTPVHILIAGSVLTISGSVGMDQSLDYLLEVPVTKRLVGREGFRVLEGTTLKVPLRGTLTNPVFNQELISEAITDLAGQAAGKAVQNQVENLLPDILNGLGL